MHCRFALGTKLLLLLLTASGLPLCASTQDADSQLNAAYRAAIAAKKVDPVFVQWTEVHWIAYRDAEANLQACIAGGGPRGNAAYKTSIDRTTRLRTTELEHIAKDGTSADLFANSRAESFNVDTAHHAEAKVALAYADLRAAAIAKKNPDLIAAFIQSQQAWLAFSNLQADYDMPDTNPGSQGGEDIREHFRAASKNRQDELRLVSLQADAAAIGITLPPEDSANSDTPSIDLDTYTAISPDHLLRIEQVSRGDDGSGNWESLDSWIISNVTGQRTLLPPSRCHPGDAPDIDLLEYTISPDQRWVAGMQKIYHGLTHAYLFERVPSHGLDYKPATREALDILAWKFFEKVTGKKISNVEEGGVVNSLTWEHGALRIKMSAQDRSADYWIVDYNLKTQKFSIPAELKQHDLDAVYDR